MQNGKVLISGYLHSKKVLSRLVLLSNDPHRNPLPGHIYMLFYLPWTYHILYMQWFGLAPLQLSGVVDVLENSQ
jgi:hypothetical protein